MDRRETTFFLLDQMCEDIEERLAFLGHYPRNMLVEGFDGGGILLPSNPPPEWRGTTLQSTNWRDFDEPLDLDRDRGPFEFVVSINSLDTVNDLPGALIQMNRLLVPGGLAIATFVGGNSLMKLRRAMLEAEPARPAARMHPLIDPRSCPELMQRADWQDAVVDTFALTVRYGSLDRLVQDLREQALGKVLASPTPPLTRAAADRARAAFLTQADEDGRVSETFEILTLTGRRSLRGT